MNDTQAKIIARNRLNSQINIFAPVILENLKPFVGTKIILQTGDLAAKFKSAMEGILGFEKLAPKLQIYRFNLSYSFVLTFKTSEPTGEFGCVYQEESVIFGKLDGGILTSLEAEIPQNKTDYSLEEIAQIRRELDIIESKKRELESKLAHFGRY